MGRRAQSAIQATKIHGKSRYLTTAVPLLGKNLMFLDIELLKA